MEHYTTKDLEAPFREYLETDKSQYQIAREYGIPRSTLNDHIRRLFGHVDEDMGRRALGLPSPKVISDKSELLSLANPDMSDRASEVAEPRVSDMSEAEGKREGAGKSPVALLLPLPLLSWQSSSASAYTGYGDRGGSRQRNGASRLLWICHGSLSAIVLIRSESSSRNGEGHLRAIKPSRG
jgi:transposase-like protein